MFLTLFRGAAATAEEEIADRNALLVLDQQIRDAASAVGHGKHALAIAVVGDERERKRIEALSGRIADLEERARDPPRGSGLRPTDPHNGRRCPCSARHPNEVHSADAE